VPTLRAKVCSVVLDVAGRNRLKVPARYRAIVLGPSGHWESRIVLLDQPAPTISLRIGDPMLPPPCSRTWTSNCAFRKDLAQAAVLFTRVADRNDYVYGAWTRAENRDLRGAEKCPKVSNMISNGVIWQDVRSVKTLDLQWFYDVS